MIHNDVLSQLQLLIKTSAPPLLEVSQQHLEVPQLMPGQKVPAHVVSNLPNGRFEVLVADKTLDMNLPRNTQPGDTLELVFVTGKPRLTFILASDLANVAATSAGASAKPQVSLSETARFLGGLLEKAAQPEAASAKGASITQTAPLLSGAPGKITDFAQSLRGALTQSGLFYESHQAQWVAGQRPLSDLLHEPQGRLSPAAAQLAVPEQGRVQFREAATNVPPHVSPTLGGPALLANQANQTGQALPLAGQQLAGVRPDQPVPSSSLAGAQPAHPETVPIVRQQLEALDTRQVLWQGQVWPGQAMDWRIEERSAREQMAGEVVQPEWQTTLRLVLPQLGEISARLVLRPQGVGVQIGAMESSTAQLMAEQKPALRQGLETSGLKLTEIKVSHDATG